jgi:hypothetical protein
LKVFPTPHVVVFANFKPDETKMSADRWIIQELDDSMCTYTQNAYIKDEETG